MNQHALRGNSMPWGLCQNGQGTDYPVSNINHNHSTGTTFSRIILGVELGSHSLHHFLVVSTTMLTMYW